MSGRVKSGHVHAHEHVVVQEVAMIMPEPAARNRRAFNDSNTSAVRCTAHERRQ